MWSAVSRFREVADTQVQRVVQFNRYGSCVGFCSSGSHDEIPLLKNIPMQYHSTKKQRLFDRQTH
jgi:hypothetical protein